MKVPFLAIMATLGCLFISGCDQPSANQDNDIKNDWTYFVETNDEFESVTTFLKTAIEEEGLAISYEGHVGDMLARTKDVLPDKPLIYKNAVFYQFCSAKLANKLFSIDAKNIASCPLSIVTYELQLEPGKVYIGYRRNLSSVDKATQNVFDEIDQLMDRIIKRAIE